MTVVIFPGTFDPITLGHQSLIERAVALFERVVVAVPEASQTPVYSPLEKRVHWIKAVLAPLGGAVQVLTFKQTLVECAHSQGIRLIVRGLRHEGDCGYELRLARVNRMLESSIETIFFAASPELSSISSSVVREVAALGGCIDSFVDPMVRDELYQHYGKMRIED